MNNVSFKDEDTFLLFLESISDESFKKFQILQEHIFDVEFKNWLKEEPDTVKEKIIEDSLKKGKELIFKPKRK